MLRKHLDFRPFDLREELFSNTHRLLGRWMSTAANNLRGGCGARETIKCEGDQEETENCMCNVLIDTLLRNQLSVCVF